METLETIRTSLQKGEWVTSIDFKDAYFYVPIQEQSRKYFGFHIQGWTYQFKALPFGLSTAPMAFTIIAKEVKLHDGSTEGYKDPPILRRLVGVSHIPPSLSPAYTGSSENVQRFRLAGEHRKVGTGTKASFQLRGLPIRPRVQSGSTHAGPVAEPLGKNIEASIPTNLFGPGVCVLDRSTNSHREASSPRLAAHEDHSMASQKHLENTGIFRKDDSITQVPAPTLTMVANR